jgi:LCP family protein required for cell wall assembly
MRKKRYSAAKPADSMLYKNLAIGTDQYHRQHPSAHPQAPQSPQHPHQGFHQHQAAPGQLAQPAYQYQSPQQPQQPQAPQHPYDPYAKHAPARKPAPHRKPKRKFGWKHFLALFTILLLIGAGSYGYTLYRNGSLIFGGNLFGALVDKGEPLKEDLAGRSNILLFGTSEDDPGHPGSLLTDSLMVVSLDQDQKNAFIFSVPRDLWVKYPPACGATSGKINAVFQCEFQESDDEPAARNLRNVIGEVFGMEIQYSVHLNYEVVQQSVDALGGVDVTIESDDSRGIMDRNFDWKCRFQCYMVRYPNGPVHLNGEQALHLARARGMGTGYGLPRGNFDRDTNQRKILIGARNRATSAGFLANPLATTRLLNALGDNVRTNIDASEIKTLTNLGKLMTDDKISTLNFTPDEKPLLTTGTGPNGTSIVRPVLGIYKYEGLQAAIVAERDRLNALSLSPVPTPQQ